MADIRGLGPQGLPRDIQVSRAGSAHTTDPQWEWVGDEHLTVAASVVGLASVPAAARLAYVQVTAAPIFWLWHGFVDDIWYEWQCDCGLDERDLFDAYTPAEKILDLEAGTADAWIKDSDDDLANEPNNESDVIYQSQGLASG